MSERREREDAGCNVVEHDAGACRGGVRVADGPRLEDVEEAEEQERERGVLPVGQDEDERDELASDLVDDDEAGVFAPDSRATMVETGMPMSVTSMAARVVADGKRKRRWDGKTCAAAYQSSRAAMLP